MPQSLEKGENPETWVIGIDFTQKHVLLGHIYSNTGN